MTDKQRILIEAHGRNLLEIFPNATERDPVTLCKKLRRLEAQAAALALRGCNGPEWDSEEEEMTAYEAVLTQVKNLLFGCGPEDVPVFINCDPRGYALKIDDEYMRSHKIKLHTDWGGYGIIAPEING